MNPLISLSITCLLTAAAQGALVVSYAEDSNAFNSTLSNTTVFDFNSRPTGNQTLISFPTVGTYDRLWIKDADQYGGAGNPSGTRYSAQGVNYVNTTTLTLLSDHSYFGFWWSAGDDKNVLSFYSGSTLVAKFTTDTLLNAIAGSPEYKGNPVTDRLNQNPAQSYAFINFFGESGTTWNKIVFSNAGTSGFESDNHTDRILPWGSYPEEVNKPYPGKLVALVSGNTVTVIPEPSSALLPLLGGGLLLLRRRRC